MQKKLLSQDDKDQIQKWLEPSSTFCVSPWMEMTLTHESWLCLCCYAHPVRDKKGRVYNLVEDRMEDYWNSWSLREIRRKMLANKKISQCKQCYYEESIGKNSRRLDVNKLWLGDYPYGSHIDILDRVKKSRTNGYKVEKLPLRLDIRPTNLCNLKCRMCGPYNSSKIEREQEEMRKKGIKTPFPMYHFMGKRFTNWHENKEMWDMIYKMSSGVKNLYFTGGEPTLVKEVWEYIDYLKEKNLAKNIVLEFNTNCTQKLDKFIRLFDSFRAIVIRFSVDGYGTVNDYIRFPSKWTNIENNIIEFQKKIYNKHLNKEFVLFQQFIPTVQVYNILNLPKLLQWINSLKIDHYLNMCTSPDFLNIDILPNNVKKVALLKLKNCENNYKKNNPNKLQINFIKNALNSEEKPGIEKHLKNFYKYTKILDRYRSNSFERTFPELNTLLNEDGRWKA